MKRSQAQTLGTSGATFLRYFCLQTYFFAYILRITYIVQLHVWKILLFAHFGSRETSTVPTDSRLNLPWNAFTCCTSFFSPAFSHKKAISNIFISSFTALRDIEHSVSPVIGSCFLCGRFYALQGKRSQSEHVQAFFIWTFIYIFISVYLPGCPNWWLMLKTMMIQLDDWKWAVWRVYQSLLVPWTSNSPFSFWKYFWLSISFCILNISNSIHTNQSKLSSNIV